MMQVDVPTTFTTSPSRMPDPTASQCASNAPTGIGMPARNPSFSAHSALKCPASLSDVAYRPPIFSRTPASTGSTCVKKLFRRQPAQRLVKHPLVPHRANATRRRRRIFHPAQHRRDHVAIFERGRELRALLRIVPQPVQQLRPSPLRRINAAAPIDRLQLRRPRRPRDLPRFFPRPVIAPQIIIVQRSHLRVHRNHARPRGIERDRLHASPETPAASSAFRIASVSARN